MMKTVALVAALFSFACAAEDDDAEPKCWYISSPDTCDECTDPDGCPNLFEIMSCGAETTGREFQSQDSCEDALDCGGCENYDS